MSQILRALQAQQAAMVRTLGELVALESPSHEREAVNAVADYLVQAFGQLNAKVERTQQTDRGEFRVTVGLQSSSLEQRSDEWQRVCNWFGA